MNLTQHPLYLDLIRTGEFNIARKQYGTDYFLITIASITNSQNVYEPLVTVTTAGNDEIAAFEQALDILRNGMSVLRDFPSPPLPAPSKIIAKLLGGRNDHDR